MAIAITLHLLGVLLWVGGMLFAHMQLRPVAAALLDPPLRLRLWVGVFGRFFPWVWASILVILGTGFWILFAVLGGFKYAAPQIHAMLGLGLVMTSLFIYLYFVPYPRLQDAVRREDWPAGGRHLARIRQLVGTNLVLGLVTSLLAVAGRYLSF